VIRKLLVANRGEIARRIFRTCHAMGIGTVAVFSDVDRRSPFVSEADEAFDLGGNAPSESYLRIEKIVEAAKATSADAIHPGYGFLAENASFAKAVLDAGLTWIGPSAKAIAAMGSKLESKRLLVGASVPILPSIDLTGLDTKAAKKAAADIGYPVLVKASAGGGGKGMRIVRDPMALEEAVAAARRESASAFGDDTVFLERYLDSPRHIEIQVFADRHGHLVSLFERECSIQRRHQKIVEEAPSPALDDDTRTRMGDAAIAVASAVGYEGAGTIEFLFQSGEFFFLEMNTRLQVEHPVTEEITGLDLVRLQILVAQGEPLPEEALQPAMLGHAIEVRLYAEDPTNDFLPVSGRLDRFEFFEAPGLRVDAGVESGSEVPIYYDPMIAKVIAWGDTREEAASLLASSLQRARLHGLTTNRDLLVRVLRHGDFLSGETDTHFLERHPPAELGASLVDRNEVGLAAVAAALAAQAERRQAAEVQPTIPSGWRNSPSQFQELAFNDGEAEVKVGYRFEPRGGITVEVDGHQLPGLVASPIDPRSVAIKSDEHLYTFEINRIGSVHHIDGPSGYVRLVEIDRFPIGIVEEEPGSLHAPMPGKVVRVAVTEGDAVSEGQVLVVMEAMKMEHTLRAPHAGTVGSVRASAGEQVAADQILVVVEASS
jgi:acetyl/propionyl-CoA carboxylase alpha subunit